MDPTMPTYKYRATRHLLANGIVPLLRVKPVEQSVLKLMEWRTMRNLKRSRTESEHPPGVEDDRAMLGLALQNTIDRVLCDRNISPRTIDFASRLAAHFLTSGKVMRGAEEIKSTYGTYPPSFLVISPGEACNLHCVGCYADSGKVGEKITWSTLDRIITEAEQLWGRRFFVISGGEPLAYRSEGKGILDLAEKHNNSFMMMYSNGTLISDEVADRLARLGNLTPAISLEGWRQKTDARRGEGVYDQILKAMERLRKAGVLFGVSLTATRDNAEEILSEDFTDFLFDEQGAYYGWIFHYMPIGRSFTL